MESLFLPYKVIDRRPESLSFQLLSGYKWLQFTAYRAVPVFVVLMLGNMLMLGARALPWGAAVLMLLLVGLSVILLGRKIVLQSVFYPQSIEIQYQAYFLKKRNVIPIQEVTYIQLVIERQSRGGNGRFSLVSKNGNKLVFALFPIFLRAPVEKFAAFSRRIEEWTGLEVRNETL